MRGRQAVGLLAAALMMAVATAASAQVREAVYRGTLVCDKLPFTDNRMREAIEVKISGNAASYNHVVRLRDTAESVVERGAGKLDGRTITLEGAWKSAGREYQARYSGTFVRRSAMLKGVQTWTDGGRSLTRNCAGPIKRPLRAFLPRSGN